MTEQIPQSWRSYLSRGYMGTRGESAVVATRSLPIPDGLGLHPICEPIDASVEYENIAPYVCSLPRKADETWSSIVFVHGLTGSSKTWYEPHSRTFWPSDLLAKDIPSARIFVWEYDADVFKIWINHHVSANTLLAHGSGLCNRLAGNRYKTSTVSG